MRNKRIGSTRWIAFCLVLWLWGPIAVLHASAEPAKTVKAENVVSPAAVYAAVKAYIARHAPWKPDQLKITRMTYDQTSSVPFRVQIMVDGQVAGRVIAPATIEVWSDVVLAVKPLGKFQPIEADDIQVKKMNLARVPANVIVRVDQVLGQRAKHNIAANSVLRNDQVESPPVVRRGEVVQMVAESAVLRVAAKGIAKENGTVGERIRVMNLRSRKIVYAQVVDHQTVQVEF
jgi:flagella basal body P-ring formation protein FlgA